jgi:hypothetical protein
MSKPKFSRENCAYGGRKRKRKKKKKSDEGKRILCGGVKRMNE